MPQKRGNKNNGHQNWWFHRRQAQEAQKNGGVIQQVPESPPALVNQLSCAPTVSSPSRNNGQNGQGGNQPKQNRRQRNRQNNQKQNPLIAPKVPQSTPWRGTDGPVEPQGQADALKNIGAPSGQYWYAAAPEKGFWDDDDDDFPITPNGLRRKVEGVAEAHSPKKNNKSPRRSRENWGSPGREIRWEQIGERRRNVVPLVEAHSNSGSSSDPFLSMGYVKQESSKHVEADAVFPVFNTRTEDGHSLQNHSYHQPQERFKYVEADAIFPAFSISQEDGRSLLPRNYQQQIIGGEKKTGGAKSSVEVVESHRATFPTWNSGDQEIVSDQKDEAVLPLAPQFFHIDDDGDAMHIPASLITDSDQTVKQDKGKQVVRNQPPSVIFWDRSCGLPREKTKQDGLYFRKRENLMLPDNLEELDISETGARLQASQFTTYMKDFWGSHSKHQTTMYGGGLEATLHSGQADGQDTSPRGSSDDGSENKETLSDVQVEELYGKTSDAIKSEYHSRGIFEGPQSNEDDSNVEAKPNLVDKVMSLANSEEKMSYAGRRSDKGSFQLQEGQPKPKIVAFHNKFNVRKENVDPAFENFARDFFSDTRTKPRDETFIHPAFKTSIQKLVVNLDDNSEDYEAKHGHFTIQIASQERSGDAFDLFPYNQAQSQAQSSTFGLNPFARPFIPGQFSTLPPPPLLTSEKIGRSRYSDYDRGHESRMIGHPAYLRRRAAVDKSLYRHSPHTHFVVSKTSPVNKGTFEPAQEVRGKVSIKQETLKKTKEKTAATTPAGVVYKSCTLYILHHAYDIGASYEDVYQVYARRYSGDETDHAAVTKTVLKDLEYLLAGRYEGGEKIKGSGFDVNGRITEEMKSLLKAFKVEAEAYNPRQRSEASLGLLQKPGWRAIQKKDKKMGCAERCIDIEIEIMEEGLAALELSARYKKREDKARGVRGLHLHLEGLRRRQEKFRRQTRKILEEMGRERAGLKVEEGVEEVVVAEEEVVAAMTGDGALCLGVVDSEDDDGGVKLSPEEAVGYW